MKVLLLLMVILSCVPYVPEPEDSVLLKTTYNLYRKFEQYPLALRCAIQLNDTNLIHEVFFECKDEYVFLLISFSVYWPNHHTSRKTIFNFLSDF
jgi:26S proteasome regulatory subunit N1